MAGDENNSIDPSICYLPQCICHDGGHSTGNFDFPLLRTIESARAGVIRKGQRGGIAADVDKPVLRDGTITQGVVIPAQGTAPLKMTYHVRGVNYWE
jgi:hypothetical protein